VRNLDIEGGTKNQADVAKRVFAKKKHGKCSENELRRVTHTLEVVLTEQLRHGSALDGGVFPNEKRVIATLVTAAKVAVMRIIVVQKACPCTDGTRWIPWSLPHSRPRAVGGKLILAVPALILLVSIRVFAVTIK